MSNIISFRTTDNGQPIGLTLKLPKDSSTGLFELDLIIHTKINTQIKIDVNLKNGSFSIHNLLMLTSLEACLAGCVVSALIGPLILCFNKDADKYKKCLKAKGLEILSDAVKCANGCATTT